MATFNKDTATQCPRVFLSYSHDSAEHAQRVLGLAQRLREDGFDAHVDQFVNGVPPKGWPRWMLDELEAAAFVLVICSEAYYRRFRGQETTAAGHGADWEGALITLELYAKHSATTKFVPVLFQASDREFIPEPLMGFTYYLLDSSSSYAHLADFLAGGSGVKPLPVKQRTAIHRKASEPLVFPDEKSRVSYPSPTTGGPATLPGSPVQAGSGQNHLSSRRMEVITLLCTELVNATRLKGDLGDVEALRLIDEHHELVRALLSEFPEGYEVRATDDSFLLAFLQPSDAACFAVRLQKRLRDWNRHNRMRMEDRLGIHTGEVTVEMDAAGRLANLHGLEVDKIGHLVLAAHSNQILLTRFAFDNAQSFLRGQEIAEVGDVRWAVHGTYQLEGVSEPVEICEVGDPRHTPFEPPTDSENVNRVATGWRRWLSSRPPSRKLSWGGAAITALAGVFSLVLPPAWPFIEGLSYDLAYLFRGSEAPDDAVIIKMDRDSHETLHQPYQKGWNRSVHAALVDKLREFGARAIVFDVFFDQPATNSEEDAAFLEAIRRHGNIAVAGSQKALTGTHLAGAELEQPFATLTSVARWGLSYDPDDASHPARQLSLGTRERASLAAEVARMYGREPPHFSRNLWLNYYGPPGTIKSVSYCQVLTNTNPPCPLKDRVAFVGAADISGVTYTGGRLLDDRGYPLDKRDRLLDERATPYTWWGAGKSSGVEIVATASLNLLRGKHGEWLRRLPPWLDVLLVVLAGIAAGHSLPRLRPIPALVIATIAGLLVALVSLLLVWPTRVWFPWLAVSAVQLPIAFAWAMVVGASPKPRKHSVRPINPVSSSGRPAL
ncbi:MAG: CHASE2 domain-containing protein [Acidobacteria bacterium]|nr:CHASE2 domain-containing protein [Acidobacteriota bacterium]